jgi:phosphoribosylaminoimidazole-succinocarboxamide synthase
MAKREQAAVFQTDIPELTLKARGKVRDVYDLGETLLFIASDRLSAFDHVLPDPIPAKGKVLNQLSTFWFNRTSELIPNHVISTDVADLPVNIQSHAAVLEGRSMMVRKLDMLPVECVARGYLAGSGWKEYREHGTMCGIELPSGLEESSRLPEPIFTPATKAEEGDHDENIPFSEATRILGADLAAEARSRTLELYSEAADYARSRGIIIADTKFEFGLDGDQLILADEVLTPDSSRFWPADDYAPGRSQNSFDKQFVRDYLESIHWDKQPPVPELPLDIVQGTRDRYLEIFKILTGGELV